MTTEQVPVDWDALRRTAVAASHPTPSAASGTRGSWKRTEA